MRKYKAFIILLLIPFISLAQSGVLEWAHSAGNAQDITRGNDIATDSNGNVYTIGEFRNDVDFDPSDNDFTMSTNGGIDIFIQKLDSNGNFIWAKHVGGDGNDVGSSIATDGNNNIYITGFFVDIADFDPGPTTFNLTNDGLGKNTFVLKLDQNGNFIWAKHNGSSSTNSTNDIFVDQFENIYLTGYFYATTDFDPGINTQNLTSNGSADIFIQKLDSDGNLEWVKQIGSDFNDRAYSIVVDNSEYIYVSGSFETEVDFDPSDETYLLNTNGSNDIFILKMDIEGNLIWAKSMGGSGNDAALSLTVDQNGDVITAGYFFGTVDFDPNDTSYDITTNGEFDIYVQKLNTEGEFVWSKNFGSTLQDQAFGITSDSSNNIYITGIYSGSVDFDPGPNLVETNNTTNSDYFVLKLDSNASFEWLEYFGGEKTDKGWAIALDDEDNVYTTGQFHGAIDVVAGSNELILNGLSTYSDQFVIKYKQCNPTEPIPNATSLPEIDAICEIITTEIPTANNECFDLINGVANVEFPISNEDIEQIIWTFDDGYGNSETQTQNINWTDLDISTTLVDQTISSNNDLATYQWLNCEREFEIIFGENNQSFTPLENGYYAVEIQQNNCIDTSECVAIHNVDIIEREQAHTINISQNNGQVSIDINKEEEEDAEIYVYSLTGKLIVSQKMHSQKFITLQNSFEKGIYLFELKTAQRRQSLMVYID